MSNSSEIKINKQSFEDVISILLDCHDEMQEAFELYVSACEDLEATWIGSAGYKFVEVFNQLKTDFQKSNDELASLAQALKETEESFSSLDADLGNTMNTGVAV